VRLDSRLLLAISLLASLAACTSARPIVFSRTESVPALNSDRHVIVISIDGLRPDAIQRFDAPTLQRLVREGRFSLTAQTIHPSVTLPSHASMMTGVDPDQHGITWNDNRVATRGRVRVPTMLATAHQHGLRTAAVVSKGKFNHLLEPGSVDHFVVPEGDGSWSSDSTVEWVEDVLIADRPNLLFVHLPEPDRYGHLFGWMGYFYGWAVAESDGAVGEILASADEAFGRDGYTVILSADHGGHDRDHGTDDPRSMTIPWIAWGRRVAPAGELTCEIHTMSTAATALWLLGVPIPESYVGQPVLDAFEPVVEPGR